MSADDHLNVREAARFLGISRTALYKLISLNAGWGPPTSPALAASWQLPSGSTIIPANAARVRLILVYLYLPAVVQNATQ